MIVKNWFFSMAGMTILCVLLNADWQRLCEMITPRKVKNESLKITIVPFLRWETRELVEVGSFAGVHLSERTLEISVMHFGNNHDEKKYLDPLTEPFISSYQSIVNIQSFYKHCTILLYYYKLYTTALIISMN